MSRSSFEPGKTTTAIAGRGCGLRHAARLQLDLVALDQRVGEQLLAHALDLGARLGGVVRLDLEVDDASDAHLVHGEAEVAQRALDRLTLRVEDPRLGPDEHGRLHPSTTSGRATYSSNAIPVRQLERLDVAAARARDDVVGELRAGVGLVPAERLAVVAHELLVERRLRAAGRVLVGRPEARRVGRERLVAEHEPAVVVDAELELRVREDDPARRGALRDEPVELEREPLDLVEALLADELDGRVAVDVLVVPGLRLRRRREDRLGQLLPTRRARPAAGARRPRRSRGSPSSRSRRGSRGRRTRSAASRAAGTRSSGRRRAARAGGSARRRASARTRTRRAR